MIVFLVIRPSVFSHVFVLTHYLSDLSANFEIISGLRNRTFISFFTLAMNQISIVFISLITVCAGLNLYEELTALNATTLLGLVDKAGLSSVLKTGGKTLYLVVFLSLIWYFISHN